MLNVDNLSKSFAGAPRRDVLRDVSLHVAPGEYVAIMGESGAGKSTLLNLIAGLDTPDSGRIRIDGRDLAGLDDAARTRLRRSKLGFVFQAFHLLPHLSVAKNVALPLALNGLDADQRVEELLAAVGMLDRRDAAPRELSGGEMQRVAMARALAHRPKLVLADEPTGQSRRRISGSSARAAARSAQARPGGGHSGDAFRNRRGDDGSCPATDAHRPSARGGAHVTTALLIDATVIGPMRHAPGRTVLAVAAIALGVALGLAIYLINRSAADEIALAARSLYGLADFSIDAGPDGLDERLYPQVARTSGVAAASPVVEVDAKLIGVRGAITLIGVDPFRSKLLQPSFASLARTASGGSASLDPNAVYLSTRAARELNLAPGDVLPLQTGLQSAPLTIAGVLPPNALKHRAGIVDIAFVQWRFGRLGELSRIDVRLAPGADPDGVRRRLRGILPAGAGITTPGSATDDALRLSRAYRSNLTALALVALFTGGFFVYSTQSLLALKRRREFAILHALGVTRTQQLLSMLAGGALIGAAGAGVGLGAGVSVATVGLRRLGADLGAGYFRGVTPTLDLRPTELAVFAVLGVGVAILGALRPALQAAHIATASALKAGDIHSDQARTHTALVWSMLALAAAALLAPPVGGLPLPGYVAIALLLLAAVAATPAIVRFVVAHAPAVRRVPWQIALAQIAGNGALRHVERLSDHRQLQPHDVDGDHGDLISRFARCVDAEATAGRSVRPRRLRRSDCSSGCGDGGRPEPTAGRRSRYRL